MPSSAIDNTDNDNSEEESIGTCFVFQYKRRDMFGLFKQYFRNVKTFIYLWNNIGPPLPPTEKNTDIEDDKEKNASGSEGEDDADDGSDEEDVI